MDTYPPQPVTFVRGEGTQLWDEAGRRYLDFFSGVAVTSLGHAHPGVADAVATQARTLLHVSNHFATTVAPEVNPASEITTSGPGGGSGRRRPGTCEAPPGPSLSLRLSLHGSSCRSSHPRAPLPLRGRERGLRPAAGEEGFFSSGSSWWSWR